MAVTIIHGPMRTGKTLHRDLFAKHYGCSRVYDDADKGVPNHGGRGGDLILSNDPVAKIAKRYPWALLIPINTARKAVGLEPAPTEGFILDSTKSSGACGADPRIKTAKGPTILLHSGSYFDLLDPHGSEFTIEDIAHGLSMTCRFAGQCRQFYSVAEHSWHTSFLVPERLALAALMHDAAEAFIGDVTRPLKSLLSDYKAIERNIEAAIAERFGIANTGADEIKHRDLMMLHAEQAVMMPHHEDRWSTSPEEDTGASWIAFRCWSPDDAKRAFLDRFAELGGQA